MQRVITLFPGQQACTETTSGNCNNDRKHPATLVLLVNNTVSGDTMNTFNVETEEASGSSVSRVLMPWLL